MIAAKTFESGTAGPRVLLLGGVHGDETPGPFGLEALALDLAGGRIKLFKGAVTIAARVNEAALRAGKHQLDENLNRIMGKASPTREGALAAELGALIDAHDAVLDLHATTEPSRPFAFLDDERPACRAWGEVLGVDFLLTGWPALYADKGTMTTTEYATSRGKLALTVEVGDSKDPHGPALAKAIAHNALARLGVAAGGLAVRPPKILRLSADVRKKGPGAFAKPWKSFDPVGKGELLARYDDGSEVRAAEDSYVIMPHAEVAVGDEWLYLAS